MSTIWVVRNSRTKEGLGLFENETSLLRAMAKHPDWPDITIEALIDPAFAEVVEYMKTVSFLAPLFKDCEVVEGNLTIKGESDGNHIPYPQTDDIDPAP